MKVLEPRHKAQLFRLFYDDNWQEKRFPLEEVVDASSILKKFRGDAEEVKNEQGQITSLQFNSKNELEFTTAESVILKKLVDGVKDAIPSQAEVITELKELVKQ